MRSAGTPRQADCPAAYALGTTKRSTERRTAGWWRASASAYTADSGSDPRQLSARPGSVLRWWQRKQGPPSRAATAIEQKRRRLWSWSSTAAPASRAA